MPRGQNPKSKENLTKGKPFNAETARKASKKSAENRKYQSNARKCLKNLCTDDELDKVLRQLLKRGQQGNLTAIDMIIKYTGESEEKTPDEDGPRLAYIPEKLPKNEPPGETENEQCNLESSAEAESVPGEV